jgi:hypothetical protein
VDKNDKQWERALEFLSEIPELNYMTQLVLMLYEDPTADVASDNRFHIELHFSPGLYQFAVIVTDIVTTFMTIVTYLVSCS